MRMYKVRSKFQAKKLENNYATIYKYEYGEVSEPERVLLYKCWNLTAQDLKILNRLERICDNF